MAVIGSTKESETGSGKKFSADDIMDKVEEYIETFQMDLAARFVKKALKLEPDNIRVLETAGPILLEVGDIEQAHKCLTRAVEIEPEIGAGKYMYLGQMAEGLEAVKCFRKGIDVMKEERNQIQSGVLEGDDNLLKGEIATGLCSIAEIFMTDAW